MNPNMFAPRALPALLAGLALAGSALLLTGCTPESTATTTPTDAPDSLIIIAGAHSGMPAADLPVEVQPIVVATIEAGAPITVITLDGTPAVSFHMAGYVVSTANETAHDNDVSAVQSSLLTSVRGAVADSDGNDLGGALAIAGDQAMTDKAMRAEIIVLDNGIADEGAPVITTEVSQVDAASIVTFAKNHDEVPALPSGTTVHLVGMGYSAHPQHDITAKQRETITAIWSGILAAAGADVTVLPTPRGGAGPSTPFTTKTIDPANLPQISVDTVGKDTVVNLGSDVLFDSGSDDLRDDSEATLLQLLDIVEGHTGHLLVAGYTDTTGDNSDNQGLSERRSASVARWLMDHGIPSSRISTIGHAENDPAVPGAVTPEDLQKNRRVVVTIEGE